MASPPQIAIVGAGRFVKTQYIPILTEMSHLILLKAIWSRTEESAKGGVEIARKYFPEVECKWGEKGLDEIIQDGSIVGVAVVLTGQTQMEMSLRMLRAGKHVIQEKPAAASTSELEYALSSYKSIVANSTSRPIWAIAENYRFEPAFVKCKRCIPDIGNMMSVQFIAEGSMNSSNPYFPSSWRRNLPGGFILDNGVHFVAGLRMLVGCEVVSVSATTSYADKTLPPPDIVSSLFQLENGCSGVFVMVVSSRSPKIFWRIVGTRGTLQVDRVSREGKQGYVVSFYDSDGQSQSPFYPFSGVNEELKTFIKDISQAFSENGSVYEAERRLSFEEGARDVAVVEAMLESGVKQGAPVQVKKF